MSRTKATFASRWWKNFFESFRYCYKCAGHLKKKYVPDEEVKRHVCEECGNITYLNPKMVVGMIPETADGHIALLQRNNEPAIDKWSFPAGFQELGETTVQGAERETFEEIQVNVKALQLLGIYSYKDAGVVTVVYHGPIKRGETPKPGLEARDVKVFGPRQIPWKDLAFRSTVDALKDWQKLRGKRKKKK